MNYIVTVGDKSFSIEIEGNKVIVDGRSRSVDIKGINGLSLYSLLVDGSSYEVFVEEREGEYRVLIGGELYTVRVEDERKRRLAEVMRFRPPPEGEVVVKAPMPGLVVDVPVKEGEAVRAKQCLLVLEAMKMENELRAQKDGIVKSVHVVKGDSVEEGQALITLSLQGTTDCSQRIGSG
jgi:biotin carboxyl carrier protein